MTRYRHTQIGWAGTDEPRKLLEAIRAGLTTPAGGPPA